MRLKSLHAREILDSRGVPTVQATLETEKGVFKGSCPSGTSSGKHEAVELRDGGERFFGKGVLKAVKNIEDTIANAVLNKEFVNQKDFDDFLIKLDGTENKSNLGANAILPVSIAFCRALACEKNQKLFEFIRSIAQSCHSESRSCHSEGNPEESHGRGPSLIAQGDKPGIQGDKGISQGDNFSMPIPCFNILEGGKHAGNNLEVQEFMVVPLFETFKENLRAAAEVYFYLKLLLIKNFGETSMNTGYEAGFAPPFKKTETAFEFLLKAIGKAGYEGKFKIGLDIAASELLHKGEYKVNGKMLSQEKLVKYYINLNKNYPLAFIEDGFGEDDETGWQKLESGIRNQESGIIVVGDDLTVTNPERIKMANQEKLCNGVIIKPNQIGTVTETIMAVNLAKSFSWKIIVSHRSGETTDDFIADFAVGVGADFIKTGAPAGGERVAKYNRLLEIEESFLSS